MTSEANYDMMNPTNPLLSDAPTEKEENELSGAKITALYCRLSQEDLRLGESASIENQKDILLRFAKEHHFPKPTFFVDDGYSGTNFDRPGFQKMLAEIEEDHVGIVITKDLSRLGRNSTFVGLYTNYTFPQHGVRYIAINDNYDTIDLTSVSNDMAGMKNFFNEFFARDTSRKIRAVNKARGERGIPLTVNIPYGYMKDPEDSKHWIIDPEAAEVVRRIFDMCMQGRGPSQIGKQLTAENILNPSSYKRLKGLNPPHRPTENPCYWDSSTVVAILERLEYTGCTVNFRTYTNSIWDKKQRDNPPEKQAIFPNTHEAIVSQDIYDQVQEIRLNRHRMTRTGKSSIFSGLVYCADCKNKLYYCSCRSFKPNQEFYECSVHWKNKEKCKGHYIRDAVLRRVVLKNVQEVIRYIIHYEDYFRKTISVQKQQKESEQISALKKELTRKEKRIAELKRLFMKIYEDNASGKLNDNRYEMLSQSYEAEQNQLETEVIDLKREIEEQGNQKRHIDQFIAKAKKYAGVKELDGYILHEFIKAIYVEAPDKSSGHRVQNIHIEYNGIGFLPIGMFMERQTA